MSSIGPTLRRLLIQVYKTIDIGSLAELPARPPPELGMPVTRKLVMSPADVLATIGSYLENGRSP
jgi:hypothetical protein